jgi:cyanophycinase-like exopeptidase
MDGPIGLHGGGEFQRGDEPFLDAMIAAARRAAEARANNGNGATDGHASTEPTEVRIVIVPTAAARGRPDRAAAMGITALNDRAHPLRVQIRIDVAPIVDSASAREAANVELLESADLIHLPGGDPDLIPMILAGTEALSAIQAARRRGAVVAGASAGGMALAEWSWTPNGGIRGLGFVAGLAVVPHYDDVRRTRWRSVLDQLAPGGIGYLGLDERTGVIAEPNGPTARNWRVAGEGAATWFARGSDDAIVARHGEVLHLPE